MSLFRRLYESSQGTSSTPGAGTVTNSMLANMSQARIKGRASGAGTGAPQDLTGAQAATILGVTAYTPNGTTADSTTITATATKTTFSNGTRNIGANTLAAGCAFEVRALVYANGVEAAESNDFILSIGGNEVSSFSALQTDDFWVIRWLAHVRSIGATGEFTGSYITGGRMAGLDSSVLSGDPTASSFVFDTTATVPVLVLAQHQSNSAASRSVLKAFDVIPFGFSL